ncbi:MAG: DMT family transporter [Pseudomonadota bacterium]
MADAKSVLIWAPPAFVVIWATGFVGAKFGLPYAEPMTFLALRFAIAAALLGVWAWVRGEYRGGARDLKGALIVGALIHGVYLGGVFTAISLGAGAAVSALIVGLQPVLTALFAGPMLGERLSGRQWLGMTLGLAGVALVVARKAGGGEIEAFPILLCVVGLIGISYASILQKRRQITERLAGDSAIQFASAAIFCFVFAAMFEEFRIDWTLNFGLALTWMVVALSLGAITLLLILIRSGEASKTASLFFLVPGVTAVMAWAMFGETFGAIELAGLIATMIGVRLVTRAPQALGKASR